MNSHIRVSRFRGGNGIGDIGVEFLNKNNVSWLYLWKIKTMIKINISFTLANYRLIK